MIKGYKDLDPYFIDFQWSEARKDQPSLFITGAEFQAHFVYFSGHTPDKRHALVQCIELFNQHFGDQLSWGGYYDENGDGHYVDYKDPKMPSIAEVISNNKDPDDVIEWHCASGDQLEAPEYMISAMTNRDWEGKLNYGSQIKFCVPNKLIFEPEKEKILMDMIQYFIQKLNPYYAVAGFQNILPYRPEGVGDYAYLQGVRFWGIYQGANVSESRYMEDGIKSIDWFTYLSNDLVQRICSVNMFPKYCQHFGLQPVKSENGFQFQLEEYPQILPSKDPVLESYFKLNQALRPLRNGAYAPISRDANYNYQAFDTEASRKWVRRLDAPDIFPDKGHYQEVKPENDRIFLESSKVCMVDGIYRYDEQVDIQGIPVHVGSSDRNKYVPNVTNDYRQHVLLLKGDIAPRFLNFSADGFIDSVMSIKWHLVSQIIRSD